MDTAKAPLGRRLLVGPVLPLLKKAYRAHHEHRASQFAQLGPPPGHVVFLGDSITEFGLWNEWFPGTPVLNRGVSAEVSAQVLRRLGTAINDPVATFLLIGTNDLATAVPIDAIAANVAAILAGIEQRAPGTPVYVQSVMPRAARFKGEIDELNRRYADIVARLPPHVGYIDLWPALATADGALNPAFSRDKLHLNGAGYRAWTEVIRPFVTALSSSWT